MNSLRRNLVVCLTLVFMLVSSGILTNAAQASGSATWASWHLRADFSQQQPHIIWTSFVGDGTTVLDSVEYDITGKCKIPQLDYDGDYAVFDGNTRIVCQTPDFRQDVHYMAPHLVQAQVNRCECRIGEAPFWFAADVRLELGNTHANPLFYKEKDAMSFALPINNDIYAQTHLNLGTTQIASTDWQADYDGNRVWMGNGGEHFLAVNKQMGWPVFMTSLFDQVGINFLIDMLPEEHLGHWVEDSQSRPVVNPATSDLGHPGDFEMNTESDTIVIGQDPRTGEYFHGMVRTLDVDPGCRGNY